MPTIVDPVIRLLADIGLVDVILPFVLVFAVMFGILEQTKVLSSRRNVNMAVAVVTGFIVLASVDVLAAVNRLTSFLSIALVTGLVLLMILGIVGVQSLEKSKPLMYVLLAVMLLGVLYVLGAFELVSRNPLTNFYLPAVLVFGIFLLLVWAVLKVKPEKKPEAKLKERAVQPVKKIKPGEKEGVLWKED